MDELTSREPYERKRGIMADEKCPNQQDDVCPCTADCERHGRCCECLRAHLSGGSLPACAKDKFVAKK